MRTTAGCATRSLRAERKPSVIISHKCSLRSARRREHFDARDYSLTRAVLKLATRVLRSYGRYHPAGVDQHRQVVPLRTVRRSVPRIGHRAEVRQADPRRDTSRTSSSGKPAPEQYGSESAMGASKCARHVLAAALLRAPESVSPGILVSKPWWSNRAVSSSTTVDTYACRARMRSPNANAAVGEAHGASPDCETECESHVKLSC